ncbi:trafficking protein particle complex subunit 4 [Tetranychus urticae]|uniref:Trafficking protein particle complex subunit n=1 Tax=Tetranychus urticae TaxID=32264 RepID=T1KMW0_TETUR|nr:trafficking protein particle complex subunit 4 [Tetranychus urticae]
MVIYSVFMVSKNGGLIYHCDHHRADTEIERTFKYPLDLKLSWRDNRLVVTFGQHDGIKVGYSLMAVNGEPVVSRKLGDKDVLEDVLAQESHYPLTLKFGIAPLSSNEKIVFASMFHSMCAIASLQINRNCIKDPSKSRSIASGIEVLETDNFRLNCFQTLTGLKIIVMSDVSSFSPRKEVLLRKIYDLYTDYALKNPFYSLDMPIRCELFDTNLQLLLEQREM